MIDSPHAPRPAPHIKRVYNVLSPRLYIHVRAKRAWRKARGHRESELRLLPTLVSRDRVALDIGANRGTYAYFLSRIACRTVAYEPVPGLARFLREARLPSTEVREAAVSDRAGRLVFVTPLDARGRPQYNTGYLSEHAAADGAAAGREVRVVRLDDEDLGDVGFIKIDVEGHEQRVIEGARDLLARCRPNLLVEILDGMGDRRAIAANPTVRLLATLGYEPYVFARGALRPLADAPLDPGLMNYVFLPRSGPDVPTGAGPDRAQG